MQFLFGCLAIVIVVLSLILGALHAGNSDYCIVHWVLGFFAALLFILFAVLGIWW